ncbi:MAG: RNA polymerase sigma-70 factor [Paludibacter sp.]|jgi:RNA polymerase sigma-70 factor (ECF subfamily)|nr:RNA polymerase sigma-70 factor [Paludibacter sp.]
MIEEQYLLRELKQGNKEAFSMLFRKYYLDMVLFGGNYLRDKDRCEDIVQNVLFKLWSEREELEINTSLKSFLLKSVKNGCLDELRHQQVIRIHESYSGVFGDIDDSQTENYILYTDLHDHLDIALKKLPEVCRVAFELNRFEGLKYKEIAQQLEVSERTVEVRIGKAIGLLRKYLKDFFILVFILLKC